MSDTEVLPTPDDRAPLPRGPPIPFVPGRSPWGAVDRMFVERWSPRAFLPEPLDPREVRALFEAARWAPSSNNQQPWVFVYATSPEDRARFAKGLNEFNRVWAERAPLLAYLLIKKTETEKGEAARANPVAMFDGGAAWMSLALQAHLLGLSAHAMGGIERDRVAELLGIPREQYEVAIAVAVGRRGDPSQLPAPLASRERPSGRRPLDEVAFEGSYPPLAAG